MVSECFSFSRTLPPVRFQLVVIWKNPLMNREKYCLLQWFRVYVGHDCCCFPLQFSFLSLFRSYVWRPGLVCAWIPFDLLWSLSLRLFISQRNHIHLYQETVKNKGKKKWKKKVTNEGKIEKPNKTKSKEKLCIGVRIDCDVRVWTHYITRFKNSLYCFIEGQINFINIENEAISVE